MAQLFITLAILFGSGVIGYFYAWPSWQDFSHIRQESENATTISAELDELGKNRSDLLSTINSVSKEDNDRISEAMPTGPHSGDLLVFLENLSIKHGVTLRRVDLTAPQDAKAGGEQKTSQPRPGVAPVKTENSTIREFPISLEIVGTYDTFKAFLGDIEHSLRIVDIQSITFSSPSLTDSRMNFSLRGKTYFQ